MDVTRGQVLAFRASAQGLDGGDDAPARSPSDLALLDLGVQDTGPDGAAWALALRGVAGADDDLATAWTLRGAPHVHRRADLPDVQVAVSPFGDADAGKRIFDANKPLKAAGIGAVEALRTIAQLMREIVTGPMPKGEVSAELTERLPEPYRRWCNPCQAVHLFEQPFRFSALHAGLELEPGTSPPMMRRVPGWPRRAPAPAADPLAAPERLQPIRAYLRLLGPATPRLVAAHLDAPLRDVTAHWPADAEPVTVDGEERWVLADDVAALTDAEHDDAVRLVGPFDPYLQGRDRDLLVPDEAHRKDLWRTLGRPGAVVASGEVVGTWRPRSKGRRLEVAVDPWTRWPARLRTRVEHRAEALAAFRGRTLAGVTDA
ncbi:winged helix DNA-binding domain-containing protein [Solicola sp. PLA-1-18]|uniref:winged helix DNA-binding domain-containing protein n=1 Tax=Solicola sp. PLA-1-18 TaxID=3380532 RepID=UPI003B784E5B